VWKVGKWLEQFDPGAIPCRVTVLDACNSFKQEFQTRYVHTYTPSSYISDSTSDHIFGIRWGKNYQRSRVIPDQLQSLLGLGTDGLSVKETALGALLVAPRSR
jgi:hypothetical protein